MALRLQSTSGTQPMKTPTKPWSNHQQVLWALGVLGLICLALAVCLPFLLQGGFGPGSNTPSPGLPELFGAALLAVPCLYYIIVARSAWTRKLWAIGVVIHLFLVVFAVFTLVASRGGSFIILPFFLAGPVAWILYAKRNKFSEKSG